MARGKNARSRPNRHQHPVCVKDQCRCVKCVTDRNLSGKNGSTPASLGHRNQQDVLNAIDYHWKILSEDTKRFIQSNITQLNLRRLVDFWLQPQRIENTRPRCASSIAGSSLFLALNYLFIDKLREAQALILHGCFMEECFRRPIENIAAMCDAMPMRVENCTQRQLDEFRGNLPRYHEALSSTSTKQSMEQFLKRLLPEDYSRRMSFASQAGRSNGHSIVRDYVGLISTDWNGSPTCSAAVAKSQQKGTDATTINITFILDNREEATVTIEASTMFKTVFNNYADDKGVSLRGLRFTHGGNLLFLSSAGNKTAKQLGIKNGGVIHVSSLTATPSPPDESRDDVSSPKATRKAKSRKSIQKKKNKCKRSKGPAAIETSEIDYRIQHSERLSQVFDEAQPTLQRIRSRLNSLNIERTLPKQKMPGLKRPTTTAVTPVCNPPSTGIGGKAGKTRFLVVVGESCNLYKSTKKSPRAMQRTPMVTDLHGLTQEEALSKLDESLPEWTDTAMKGSYPFVIPVNIITGGGNQILAEAVENWIRTNSNVANAPRRI